MTKNDYLNKRDGLMTNAQALIDEGKLEDADKVMDDIKALDMNWETTTKAQANLRALTLEDNAMEIPEGVKNEGTVNITGASVETDPYNSIDYRRAFAAYVGTGDLNKIPVKYRAEAGPTKTTDIGAVIPTVIVEKIVEALETSGQILGRVTRTAYEPGAAIPVSSIKPVASWVAEGNGSNKQKLSVNTSIVFAGYKLRCEVTMTLEAATRSLDMFERYFVQTVSKAMVKALEAAIVGGTGNGQPKGILAETPITDQAIETAGTSLAYKDLVAAESALPLAYEDGAVWIMTKKNFGDVEGLVDDHKQPVARVNYGLADRIERKILGRPVVLIDALPAGAPWGFIVKLDDYVLNTNYSMRVSSRENWDNEDHETKAVMIADGKLIDKGSLVTLSIKA